jgi:hypothetical protein
VAVTVYVPAGTAAVVDIVSVEVAVEPGVRGTLAELKVVVNPLAAGDTDAESATEPVNPELVRVQVEVAEPPATKLGGVAALHESEKSAPTVIVTVAVCEMAPLVPVTVIV